MTFRDYVNVLRERWLLVVLGVLLGLGGGGAHAFLATPQYAASTTFFISTPDLGENVAAAYQGQLLSTQKIKSYIELATGRRIRDEVSRVLGTEVAPGTITATARPDTVLLTITATDPSPRRAKTVVDLVADRFTAVVDEVERPSDPGPALVAVRKLQDSQLPTEPVSPRQELDLALGFLLGLMAGVGAAVARHTLDRSVKSAEVLADLAGAPLLGTTAYDSKVRSRPLIVHDQPRAPLAEAFRQLRTNLDYVDLDHPAKLIVVTSALPGEGKTTTTCNLAIALAQAGNRVALVEADLRRPKAGEYLGMESAVGLTSVLTGQVDLEVALQPWGGGLLDFLGSGPLPPNPSELLASQQMVYLLHELNRRYDVVLFDAAPTLPVADAAVLAANCHGVLLVGRYGKVRLDQVRMAAANLARVSAKLFGVVLTMTPRPKRRHSYEYGYYGGSAVDAATAAALSPASPAGNGAGRGAPERAGQAVEAVLPVPEVVLAAPPAVDPVGVMKTPYLPRHHDEPLETRPVRAAGGCTRGD